jgi:hypothetical protein
VEGIPHFWLYLPNTEMALDLEVNEVEVKVLTSLASVTWITAYSCETCRSANFNQPSDNIFPVPFKLPNRT